MLGSSHDGERAAAALKATEFLKVRNLTWEEFIRRIVSAKVDRVLDPPQRVKNKSCVSCRKVKGAARSRTSRAGRAL
jgi:hypothetical protein